MHYVLAWCAFVEDAINLYKKAYVAPDQKLLISIRISLSIMHVLTTLMFLKSVNYRNTPVNGLGVKEMAASNKAK